MSEQGFSLGDFRVVDLLEDSRYADSALDQFYLADVKLKSFLRSLGLDEHAKLFQDKKKVWPNVKSITLKNLWNLGMRKPTHRLLLRGVLRKFFLQFDTVRINAQFFDVSSESDEFKSLALRMDQTIVKHREIGAAVFDRYDVFKIERVVNARRAKYYDYAKERIGYENNGSIDERSLFHGSIFADSILEEGFDLRLAAKTGYFGPGVYLAAHSSKSNLYVFGGEGAGCPLHDNSSCTECPRKLLINQVTLGKHESLKDRVHLCHGTPFCHSVIGVPTDGPDGLEHTEFVVYRDEQAREDLEKKN